MKTFLSAFLIQFLALSLIGQDSYPKPDILSDKDALILKGTENEYAHFVHEVLPKQTLYSIAKAYGTPMQEILQYNPVLSSSSLPLGFELKVPLSSNKFSSEKPNNTAQYIPVYYKVKKGQTLFALAHRILNVPLFDLMVNNKKNDPTLSPDELLLVGWISLSQQETQPVDSSLFMKEPEVPPTTIPESSRSFKKERETSIGKLQVLKGAAHWSKAKAHRSGYFVLTSDIPKGTEVELYNPMSRRSVFATIVGSIPEGLYEDHIVAIVSSDVAKDLRVMDQTFYLHIRYLQ